MSHQGYDLYSSVPRCRSPAGPVTDEPFDATMNSDCKDEVGEYGRQASRITSDISRVRSTARRYSSVTDGSAAAKPVSGSRLWAPAIHSTARGVREAVERPVPGENPGGASASA